MGKTGGRLASGFRDRKQHRAGPEPEDPQGGVPLDQGTVLAQLFPTFRTAVLASPALLRKTEPGDTLIAGRAGSRINKKSNCAHVLVNSGHPDKIPQTRKLK